MGHFHRDTLRVEQHSPGAALISLDVPGKALNVVTQALLADLEAALHHVAADSAVKLLVVRGGKSTGFLAGADLHEFAGIQSAEQAAALSERGQKLLDQLESLPIPSVAAIHGPCLGGGLELALACDYRLVVDHPATQLGLPEIEIGLLPGWGGTQRLPNTIGLERALLVILGGRRLDARQARRWGLADAVLPMQPELTPRVLCELASGLTIKGKRVRVGLPLTTWRQRILESTTFGRQVVFNGAERLLQRRVPDDMPAPREALEAVRVGVTQGRQAGLAYERRAIGRLATTPACHNLIHLFFQREQSRKLTDSQKEAAGKVRKVGVVGAGIMGAGIAQLAAVRGLDVVVQEVSPDALGAGLLRIATLFEKAVERRILTRQEADKRLSAIQGSFDWKGFEDVDVVIEAAVEERDAKKAVFRELEKHTRPTAVLATNTSSLSVKQLQDGMLHPERVAGLHFFNPVHKMPLVEVVRTDVSSRRVLEILFGLAVRLGKTPVVVRDGPGFVVNRVLMPYLNEAVLLVIEGLPPQRIDQVMQRFGMPMGPLELLDQVGLDVAAHIARAMTPVFKDRFPPNDAFERMVQNGWLGQKSGKGFYVHRRRGTKVNHLAVNLLRQGRSVEAIASLPPGVQAQQARERLVLGMVNEAAACLGEGVADQPETVDLALVLGVGWAPHRGGPLRYARDRGLENVLQVLGELERTAGPRFTPCAELRRMAGAISD